MLRLDDKIRLTASEAMAFLAMVTTHGDCAPPPKTARELDLRLEAAANYYDAFDEPLAMCLSAMARRMKSDRV
jgi:hypothetical protein